MKIEILGDADEGMTLAEVREFVSRTADWDGNVWIDCFVPDETKSRQLAALMGLQGYSEDDHLRAEVARWQAGEIDKFEFYDATKRYPAAQVARLADVPLAVVQDRRRYLRQLRQQRNSR